MLKINAEVVHGMGIACKNLKLQIPLFVGEFPEAAECFPGTINLRLENPVTLVRPDHRFGTMTWVPGSKRREVFEFLKVGLNFSERPSVQKAWLYVAHNSPHRDDPHIHEVIAPEVKDLESLSYCQLFLPRGSVSIIAKTIPQA
ncbi:hypothetical protein [Insolitispirillum peregrinum]|uniref:hypothetical protein n=1 Tax=Insolitispirillum peregrinum TaxID=80876 RepID=UPI0036237BB1